MNSPFGIAIDVANGELFVANNFDPGTVTVYSRTANGNVAPLRTIAGASTDIRLSVSEGTSFDLPVVEFAIQMVTISR